MLEFKEIYNELKKDNDLKNKWEEAKKENKRNNNIAIIILIIINGLILILNREEIKSIFINKTLNVFYVMPIIMMLLVINAIVYVCIHVIFNKKEKQYYKQFKGNIINKIINNFYTDVEYFPEKEMPQRIYDEPVYNEKYNEYNSDDYIEAKLKSNYYIEMAEIHTIEEIEKYDPKTKETTKEEIEKFHGLFEKLTINKSINSIVKIIDEYAYEINEPKLEMDSRGI